MLTKADREIRRSHLTATAAVAVAGLNPWRTPMSVWLDYCDPTRPEKSPAEQRRMNRGHFLEAPVARHYARRNRASVKVCRTVIHPGHDWIAASPDREVKVDGKDPWGLEIKVVGARLADHWGESGSDEIPTYVRGQVEWQMACMGWARCDVAALVDGEYREYVVLRDADIFESMRELGDQFWREHVLSRVPPAMDGSDATKEWLSRRFPRHHDMRLAAPAPAYPLAEQFMEARARRLAAEADEEKAKQALQLLIGDSQGLEGSDWRATWKLTRTGRADWKAYALSLGGSEEAALARFATPDVRKFECKPIRSKTTKGAQ